MLVSTIAPTGKAAGLITGRSARIHHQPTPDQLVQDTLRLRQGVLGNTGALVINTGRFTGRSPKDRYIVNDSITTGVVDWNQFNQPMPEENFQAFARSMQEYFDQVSELWIQDAQACADIRFRMNIRVTAENPWSALFVYNMFLRPDFGSAASFEPDWHVYVAPGLKLDPVKCGTGNGHAVAISFKERMVLIAGTGYTGEIKKSIFTALNFLLPQSRSVLSMHCAANMGEGGDTALFFGLSGTGKTTLSADPKRSLIGDDEHGWTRDGIFNFEGGCYAKVINLSAEKEPQIYGAIRQGALLENTAFRPGSNEVDFSSPEITENTRVSYPLHYIQNSVSPSIGAIPSNIFFLTCDAYGVLPPISRLTTAQAMYHFISGYTAKIAGTEAGITEPVSTFSACFGAPFLPLHPGRYASMLGERITQSKVHVWLVNTGWTGGPYGTGSRIALQLTRNMIAAALRGQLLQIPYVKHPLFGVEMPVLCTGVPSAMLNPRNTWADSHAYEVQANKLAKQFAENFLKYSDGVSEEIRSAGPIVAV